MIEEFGRLLARHGIHYRIVGGQAVAREVPTATEDIAALVLVRNLENAARELAKDPAVRFVDPPTSGMAGGQVRIGGTYTDFDLLDPAAYSGNRPGSEFFAYVRRRRSNGEFATPPVVWYMRLVAADLGIYGSKVATDIRNGAPTAWFDVVRKIARLFGTRAKIDQGIEFVQELLRITGTRSTVPGD